MSYVFTKDVDGMDVDAVHAYLTRSYWATGISKDLVRKSMGNSLCYAVLKGADLVGFARVITDQSTFAYLVDVFVLEEHRGLGLGVQLMEFVLSDPRLQGLRRFVLATRDAHGLYSRFGFQPLGAPDRFMEINQAGLYLRQV